MQTMADHALDIIKNLMSIVFKAGQVSDVFNLKHLKKFNFNETYAIRYYCFCFSCKLELDQLVQW